MKRASQQGSQAFKATFCCSFCAKSTERSAILVKSWQLDQPSSFERTAVTLKPSGTCQRAPKEPLPHLVIPRTFW